MTTAEAIQARLDYPRTIAMVERHVDNPGFAVRIVVKAASGEELYKRIIRDAWVKRKVQRWQRRLKTG